jgi:excisionase family DNA binding protein
MSVRSIERQAPSDQLLSVPEAAEYLNVTVRWMRRAIAEKRFAYVKVGANVRIYKSVLDTYIEENTVDAVEDEPCPRQRKRPRLVR